MKKGGAGDFPKGGKSEKVRLDHLLVRRGLAETGAKAQALILAGRVRAPGIKNVKPGEKVAADQPLERVEDLPYVSRGGLKLEAALSEFKIDVTGRVCVDIGASTGGFTDCLLERGAKSVMAVDVGHGQLHWKLRKDPRVANREKTHVLSLSRADLGGSGPPSLVVVDVSFISLAKVLPHLASVFDPGTEIVSLVKPQFEAGPKGAPGGVVKDPKVRAAVLDRVVREAAAAGFEVRGTMESPLRGPKGNVEHFIFLGIPAALDGGRPPDRQ